MSKLFKFAIAAVFLLANTAMATLPSEVTKPANWFVQAHVGGEVVRLITPSVADLAADEVAASSFTYIVVPGLDVFDPSAAIAAFEAAFPSERFFVDGAIGSKECSLDGPKDPDANGCFNDDGIVGAVGPSGLQVQTW